MRDAGAAVLFISHRFDEVFALCQRITILRDGRWVSTDPADALTVDQLVRRMVGREVSSLSPKLDAEVREARLELRGLTRHGVFSDVSFTVSGGEIVALAGLVGAGRSEVVRAVFGIDRYDGGEVLVEGTPLPKGSVSAAVAAGLALVPEDRRQQGLIMELSVERNATPPRRWSLSRLGLLPGGAERRSARRWAERLQVRAARLSDPVSTLSGGNQQKVVLAKWLSTRPRVLLVDEPTRGIDVGTKAEVHRLLSQLAADGVAVLMVSSELPEVLGMADRVLLALALALLIGFTAAVDPRFLGAQSIKDLLLGSTILATLAVGQAIVVITRNVDLSVGSVLGLVSFATGSVFLAAPGTPIVVALLLGVALGAVCGAVNGGLIAAARVPALVVTLASGIITGKEGDKFTAGKPGEFTVGADATVLLGDPFTFDASNIDQSNF